LDWKLEVIVVPVSDVDRAREFYTERLGFVLDHDTRVSESMRVVQLTPPGSACSIVVGTGIGQGSTGSVKGMQLVVADVEEAASELRNRGFDPGPVVHFEGGDRLEGPGGPWNSFLFFEDPDGNGWAVQQGAPTT
jgi:catechol 2,3-dioxygenase-like lactoylglutathione lyase family enzyme